MSGLSDKLSGKAKQAAGQATNDKQLQNEGKADEAKGTLKDKLNTAIDTFSDKMDDAKRKMK